MAETQAPELSPELSIVVAIIDGGVFGAIAKFMPTYGLAKLARLPLTGDDGASIALAVLNLAVWAAVFICGAAYLFRRDTRRV